MRIGIVIKLRPECVESYKKLHDDNHPGVRGFLIHYHLFNFSIFLHQIGDDFFAFGYYEYKGENFESDMSALAKD